MKFEPKRVACERCTNHRKFAVCKPMYFDIDKIMMYYCKIRILLLTSKTLSTIRKSAFSYELFKINTLTSESKNINQN